jgi:RNA polymerase sigma factor (sigma-70 family)
MGKTMVDSDSTDAELLGAWVERRDEPSFHALVSRHAGLVLSAARRKCGNDALASEASQLTFILLARKAASLVGRTSLAGWLHITAMRQTKDLMRQTKREQHKRDRLAMETGPDPDHDAWLDVRPVIDEAIASLPEKDREALLLRFYRSMSVREVAAVLGIATDAAQKRIDRATERLRGKLIRLGCQTGVLSAGLLAGLASDAQAATPAISSIVAKATATGTATAATGFGSSIAWIATAMKTTSSIPPVIALLAAALWTGTKFQALSAVEAENARWEKRIGEASLSAATSTKPASKEQAMADNRPLNWQRLASEERYGPEFGRLLQMVPSMNRETLIATLDEISRLDCSEERRTDLQAVACGPMVELDPEWLLDRFRDRLRNDPNQERLPLSRAFGVWSARDLTGAIAWLDSRLAAGDFRSRSLRDIDGLGSRASFEAALLGVLLDADFDSATSRFSTLTAEQKLDVMQQFRNRQLNLPLEKQPELPALANLIRDQFPREQGLEVIFQAAPYFRTAEDYPVIAAYLDKIDATQEERIACTEKFSGRVLVFLIGRRKLDDQDIDTMRNLFRTIDPESVEPMTGRALSYAAGQNTSGMQLAQTSAIALQIMERAGSDEALATLLETISLNPTGVTQALNLADRISDPARRAEVVKRLESLESP